MNPGMLQNTKINIQNQIHSYRLVTSHPKKKLRKQVSLTLASKNNILRRLETGCQSEGHELPPLMKTPRSYLTAEQSSTKMTRTYQKWYYISKNKEATTRQYEVCIHNKIPYHPDGQPTNWNIYYRDCLTRTETEPHIRLPRLRVSFQKKSLKHLTLKNSGAWLGELRRTVRSRNSTLGEHTQGLMYLCQDPRKK